MDTEYSLEDLSEVMAYDKFPDVFSYGHFYW